MKKLIIFSAMVLMIFGCAKDQLTSPNILERQNLSNEKDIIEAYSTALKSIRTKYLNNPRPNASRFDWGYWGGVALADAEGAYLGYRATAWWCPHPAGIAAGAAIVGAAASYNESSNPPPNGNTLPSSSVSNNSMNWIGSHHNTLLFKVYDETLPPNGFDECIEYGLYKTLSQSFGDSILIDSIETLKHSYDNWNSLVGIDSLSIDSIIELNQVETLDSLILREVFCTLPYINPQNVDDYIMEIENLLGLNNSDSSDDGISAFLSVARHSSVYWSQA